MTHLLEHSSSDCYYLWGQADHLSHTQITNSLLRSQLTSLSLYPDSSWPRGSSLSLICAQKHHKAKGDVLPPQPTAGWQWDVQQEGWRPNSMLCLCYANNSINITGLLFALHGILEKKGEDLLLFKSEAGLSHCRFRSTWKHVHYTTPGSRKPKRLRYLLLLGTLGNCTMQQSTCTSLSEKNLMILLEQLTPHSCLQIQQHDPSIL